MKIKELNPSAVSANVPTPKANPNSILVVAPKVTLVVGDYEKREDVEVAKKDSFIYCGGCGGKVGRLTKDLLFPFSVFDFMTTCADQKFNLSDEGLRCKRRKCNRKIITGLTNIVFTPLEIFSTIQAEELKAYQSEAIAAYVERLKKNQEVQSSIEKVNGNRVSWYRKIINFIKSFFHIS